MGKNVNASVPALLSQVVAVDHSLVPPAYSIELPTGMRETEAERLRPVVQEDKESELMRGHADPTTAAKEAAARALEV